MGNHGDDCYFFYYSTCTKGDNCPFRHCTAALGNEVVCNLWQEGQCFRTVCKFRHMEITKKRKEIPCFWEKQSAGCQKPHCAFFHEKPRTIEGIFFPADKSQSFKVEQPFKIEEQAAAPAAAVAAVAAAAAVPSAVSPQLRSVIKPEATEPVPSPTHPPVVINAADDDEDEDEEGETGPSPRKIIREDETLNFGVSTLEEIRLRKALQARAVYTCQSADVVTYRQSAPLRRSLADRLGKTLVEEQPPLPQSDSKPVKDRLGFFTGSSTNAAAEINTDSRKAHAEIRIKTLEEIRKEKAAKSHQAKEPPAAAESVDDARRAKALRKVTVATGPASKTRTTCEAPRSALRAEPGPPAAAPASQGIQVKTLEEIRREKVARMEVQRGQGATTRQSGDSESCLGKSPRATLVKRTASQGSVGAETTSSKVSVKSPKAPAAAPAAAAPPASITNGVKVKTFTEIMAEKRLRQRESEERPGVSPEAGPGKDPASQETSKRRVPDRVTRMPGSPSPPPTPTTTPPSAHKTPVQRTLISLKSKATLVRNGGAGAVGSSSPPAAEPSRLLQQQKAEESAAPQAKRARTVPHGSAAGSAPPDPTARDLQEKVTAAVKVRPKLNVKPSVVKPEAHVKPGHKRKAAERSAVAAAVVKPLNSATAGRQEPLQAAAATTTSRSKKAFPPASSSEDRQGSTVPCQRSNALPLTSGPSVIASKAEELQAVPTFQVSQDARSAAAKETSAVSQSPQTTSTQPRARRASSTASAATPASAAPVDDLDKLIMEFTDEDMLDDGVDNDVNEDDLLQELSEMIEIDG